MKSSKSNPLQGNNGPNQELRDWLKCFKDYIMKPILKNPKSNPFRKPVDAIALGIYPAYFQVVTHPMDLGTMRYSFWALKFSKNAFFVYYHRIAYIIFKAKVGLLDFRSHLKYGPFTIQPLFHFSKSRLVLISDPHWNYLDRGPPSGQLPFEYCPLNSRAY